jgi:segregation and condensation protein A
MYTVQLEKFQGPLDVLLQLIEEQKLPITEISLAQVTQQFLDHIKTLASVDPNVLADFLTVASKLLVIKSKSLLPTLAEELEADEEATDLTYQLLQFKKFKEVAKHLRALEAKNRWSYSRDVVTEDYISFYPDPNATLGRLHSAVQSVCRSLEEITRLPKQIVKEVISIAQKIRELQNFLSQKIEMRLSEAIKSKSRTEIIVTFLAMLELVKQRILSVEQESVFADITIKKRSAEPTVNEPVV